MTNQAQNNKQNNVQPRAILEIILSKPYPRPNWSRPFQACPRKKCTLESMSRHRTHMRCPFTFEQITADNGRWSCELWPITLQLSWGIRKFRIYWGRAVGVPDIAHLLALPHIGFFFAFQCARHVAESVLEKEGAANNEGNRFLFLLLCIQWRHASRKTQSHTCHCRL